MVGLGEGFDEVFALLGRMRLNSMTSAFRLSGRAPVEQTAGRQN